MNPRAPSLAPYSHRKFRSVGRMNNYAAPAQNSLYKQACAIMGVARYPTDITQIHELSGLAIIRRFA